MKNTASSPYASASPVRATMSHRIVRWPISFWFIISLGFFGLIEPITANTKEKPRVRSVAVKKLVVGDTDQSRVSLEIEISGDHLSAADKDLVVKLVNLETGAEIPAKVMKHDGAKIFAKVENLVMGKDPVKYGFRVSVNNESAIAEANLSDFVVEVKKEEEKKPKAGPIQITFESFKSEEYPNLHSLLITNKSEDPSAGFSSNPALMKVDIVPPGATNVNIQPSGNSYQMLVNFVAPEDFVPKGVIVTVFETNNTLANNQPRYFSTPFKEKEKKADPNQPKIDEIAITSMQRHSGYGTLRLTGSGFGDYERPPITGERELLCILHRPRDPRIADEQEDRIGRKKEDQNLALADLPVKDLEVCRGITEKAGSMAGWRSRIEERVNVTLQPRNPDLRIERTQIMHIDDKVIDVYFEFTRFLGYSAPLRLESATVSINKGAVPQSPVSDDANKFSAVLSAPQTYVVPKTIGPVKNKSLEYKYLVLNEDDARNLFGEGVGESFYVIELTVVNNGKSKVAIPLGSIEAEAAWLYGESKNGKEFFDEGPPTLPALPLGAVSGYFDSHQKSKGKWAKVFNIIEGVATLSTAMWPIIHELERPTGILRSGVVPGLRHAIGDLSSEQLARLTSLSWENVEEIVAGGSKSKFIYIPRADQFFGDVKASKAKQDTKNQNSIEYKTRKRVINIIGLEVAGFEVLATEKIQGSENGNGANGNGNGNGAPKP